MNIMKAYLLSSSSIAYQVAQPEIDGLTDYIWVAGKVQNDVTGQYYYEPLILRLNGSAAELLPGQSLEERKMQIKGHYSVL